MCSPPGLSHEYGPVQAEPPLITKGAGTKTTRTEDGNQERHTSVITYADDVTIFVTSIADFPIIEEAIPLFERASGARLNPRKSKAMSVGDGAQGKPSSGLITTHMSRYSV